MRKILIFIALVLLMGFASAQSSTIINISDTSLEQKIAQMIVVAGNSYCEEYTKMGIGGIFINEGKTAEEVKKHVERYQNSSGIKLLVAADMEGYWNPFVSFFPSKNFGEIKNAEEARELGESHGLIMRELGLNIDFSPVVEARNTVWPGRSFTGTPEEVNAKINSYITALQNKGVLATAKHYPGGSMLRDPHVWKTHQTITSEDISYFETAINAKVAAIMIGHPVVQGALDSKRKQASVSPEVIAHLRKNFNGIIITDSINMMGLRWSYLFSKKKIYVDSVKAGNDIILDSVERGCSPSSIKRNIAALKKEVEKGKIPESQIDKSVERILNAKGYGVVGGLHSF